MVILADIHKVRKDARAASHTMEKALESMRIALGLNHPEVTKSVLSLAAIYCEFDRSRDAVELLQKELEFSTEEGKITSPGVSQAPCNESGTA